MLLVMEMTPVQAVGLVATKVKNSLWDKLVECLLY